MCLLQRWLVPSITELSPPGDQASLTERQGVEGLTHPVRVAYPETFLKLSLRGTLGTSPPWPLNFIVRCPFCCFPQRDKGKEQCWRPWSQVKQGCGSQCRAPPAFWAVAPHPPLPLFPVVLKRCLHCPLKAKPSPPPPSCLERPFTAIPGKSVVACDSSECQGG